MGAPRLMTAALLAHLVLCSVDFSKYSDRAADHALSLAREFAAPLLLLHVYEEPTFATPDDTPALSTATTESRYRSRLADLESYRIQWAARYAHVLAQLERADRASVAQTIVSMAQRAGAFLIVVGTHGRSGLRRLVFGSTTQAILRVSPIPVLAVSMS